MYSVPYFTKVPDGIVPGRSIIIKGVVTADDRFAINLKCGEDYGFHFNPRPSQGCVVMNHCQGGWGPEERIDGSMFQPGQPFEICIHVQPNEYTVFIKQNPDPHFFNIRLFPLEKIVTHYEDAIEINEITYV
ncbi:galectin-5-like [Saccostrea cucullata]|uniref:galectin-5-like n=1 Tax=Saccostrea cuccullata TaxID=36930 RepID=UPI002ED402B8